MPYLHTILRAPQGRPKTIIVEDFVLILPIGDTLSYADYMTRFAKTARVEVRIAGLLLSDLFAAMSDKAKGDR